MNDEIFNITQEEAAEVIQAISKIKRFGLDSVHPSKPDWYTNKIHLEEELGDLQCCIDILVKTGVVDRNSITIFAKRKLDKLKVWSNINLIKETNE